MNTVYNMNIESMCALSALTALYRNEGNDAIADCLEHANNMLELINSNIANNVERRLDISNTFNL